MDWLLTSAMDSLLGSIISKYRGLVLLWDKEIRVAIQGGKLSMMLKRRVNHRKTKQTNHNVAQSNNANIRMQALHLIKVGRIE